jgi:DeoR/GlpR family transcriptional regulator of sugar metabolism
MDTSSRRLDIQEAIQREGYVRLSALSEAYGVSPVTIHRDLDYLASIGVAKRIRGGAQRVAAGTHEIMSDFVLRKAQAAAQKVAIANRALEEITDGSTVFFDSSTTVLALAQKLETVAIRGLTVVTNSPAVAFHIHAPYAHVIVAPGELEQSLRAITGRWTAEFLSSLSITTAFLSAAGLSLHGGMMTNQRELAEVTKAVFARSERRILLADSSKFDTAAMMTMGALAELSLVITDDLMDDVTFERYTRAGVPLVRAGAGRRDEKAVHG